MTTEHDTSALESEVRAMLARGAGAYEIAQGAVQHMRLGLQSARCHGTTCPVCDQRASERRLGLTPLHIEALAVIFHEMDCSTVDFFHAPSMTHAFGSRPLPDFVGIAHFGLVEPLELTKRHKAETGGMYRLTEAGCRFLEGNAAAAKAVRIYNGEVISVSPETVTVHDVWGSDFDLYADVVRAAPPKRGILAEA